LRPIRDALCNLQVEQTTPHELSLFPGIIAYLKSTYCFLSGEILRLVFFIP
jgi:hypothetical protein